MNDDEVFIDYEFPGRLISADGGPSPEKELPPVRMTEIEFVEGLSSVRCESGHLMEVTSIIPIGDIRAIGHYCRICDRHRTAKVEPPR